MPTFSYRARTRGGEAADGTVEAHDRRAAMQEIERQGLVPVSVREGSAPAARGKKSNKKAKAAPVPRGATRMRRRDVLAFTTELSDLLASGMTLGNALNCLASRDTARSESAIITALRDDIIRGTSLSEALGKHPKTFGTLYASMIQAGEASGALHEVLGRLVVHYERMQDLKDKVVMALVYPVIVLVMGVGVLIFAMVAVVPKFKKIFDTLDQQLPLPTKILMGLSEGTVKYGWAIAVITTIVVVLLFRVTRSGQGQFIWHRILLKAPLIRGIVASSVFANMARTLGTLLGNGVPALQALGIVERTVTNVVLRGELKNARERVTDGTTISGPLAAGKVFPRMMTDMLSIGEQTGDMPSALGHIARRYENELDRNVKIFTTALEPILIVLVAGLVGFIAIAIVMAVFSMTNGL
ncbi:MAG: type II secretion system F family protein [Verrucomicrobia bacterium]|jgi:type IV pilus assembly protein PilC|nr:type II secretion system F family protein [Verrucomicrobiota bacterium]MBT7065487.1 type II secretion system F family protein [Verrucomicrobiota bacterium]MBT7699371.1 type II secretion system F family protein [Verrucomicrobiota bacterium]